MAPVSEVPPRFKSSDGREHATREAAERRQELLDARRAFDAAKRAYGFALAETQVAADGTPFELARFQNYYMISYDWSGRPSLRTVPYLGWETEVSVDDGRVELVKWERRHHGDGYDQRRYPIADLYADERTAKQAVREKEIEWFTRELKAHPHLQAAFRAAMERATTDEQGERMWDGTTADLWGMFDDVAHRAKHGHELGIAQLVGAIRKHVEADRG